jgi:hypothetical protein
MYVLTNSIYPLLNLQIDDALADLQCYYFIVRGEVKVTGHMVLRALPENG